MRINPFATLIAIAIAIYAIGQVAAQAPIVRPRVTVEPRVMEAPQDIPAPRQSRVREFDSRFEISAATVKSLCGVNGPQEYFKAQADLLATLRANAQRELAKAQLSSVISADEMGNDILTKVFLNCDTLRGKADFEVGGYVQRIVQNSVTDKVRAIASTKKVIAPNATIDGAAQQAIADNSQNPAGRVEARDFLTELLTKLTPTERKVVEGLVMEMTREEIAESLGISANTVRDHQNSIHKKYTSLILGRPTTDTQPKPQ